MTDVQAVDRPARRRWGTPGRDRRSARRWKPLPYPRAYQSRLPSAGSLASCRPAIPWSNRRDHDTPAVFADIHNFIQCQMGRLHDGGRNTHRCTVVPLLHGYAHADLLGYHQCRYTTPEPRAPQPSPSSAWVTAIGPVSALVLQPRVARAQRNPTVTLSSI